MSQQRASIRNKIQRITVAVAVISTLLGSTPMAQAQITSTAPCTPQESWKWQDSAESQAFESNWLQEMNRFLNGKTSAARSFANALALKKISSTPTESLLSEYWISRSLQEAGLVHLAHQGLEMIVNQEVTKNTLPIQLAALGCLASVQRNEASMTFGSVTAAQLEKLSQILSQTETQDPSVQAGQSSSFLKWMRPTLWKSAVYLLMHKKDQGKESPELQRVLKGSGNYEVFARVIMASAQYEQKLMIQDLSTLLKSIQGDEFFKPYLEHLKMLYARALFGEGQWDPSIAQYKAIHPRSNEWVNALSELSWAYLRAEKYREAIGAGIGLQSGNLRQTFAPEAMMVMAISLNEMCRYPESMNVIQSFRKNYFEVYNWLKAEGNKTIDAKELYKMAVAFARRDPALSVPHRIASEWIRSPLFIANQERINHGFKERSQITRLGQQGKDEKKAQILKIVQAARGIYQKLKLAKEKNRGGSSFATPAILAEVRSLKSEVVQFQRLKNALPPLKRILALGESKSLALQKELVTQIGTDLNQKNIQMAKLLDEIGENIELLEIEIWNGASDDIVWQNAHPEYKKIAQEMKETKVKASAGQVWNWGKIEGGFDGKGEIWEDEVGSLSADLYDNCESKDKFLGLGLKPSA